jgi:hypothetical protein
LRTDTRLSRRAFLATLATCSSARNGRKEFRSTILYRRASSPSGGTNPALGRYLWKCSTIRAKNRRREPRGTRSALRNTVR